MNINLLCGLQCHLSISNYGIAQFRQAFQKCQQIYKNTNSKGQKSHIRKFLFFVNSFLPSNNSKVSVNYEQSIYIQPRSKHLYSVNIHAKRLQIVYSRDSSGWIVCLYFNKLKPTAVVSSQPHHCQASRRLG